MIYLLMIKTSTVTNILIIWDDTQVYEIHAIEMANKLNKKYTTINCKHTGGYWGPLGGKKFTLIE